MKVFKKQPKPRRDRDHKWVKLERRIARKAKQAGR